MEPPAKNFVVLNHQRKHTIDNGKLRHFLKALVPELGVGLREVGHHALLNVPWAVLEGVHKVLDQLVPLPRLERPVALPGLGEIVRPGDLLPHQLCLVAR